MTIPGNEATLIYRSVTLQSRITLSSWPKGIEETQTTFRCYAHSIRKLPKAFFSRHSRIYTFIPSWGLLPQGPTFPPKWWKESKSNLGKRSPMSRNTPGGGGSPIHKLHLFSRLGVPCSAKLRPKPEFTFHQSPLYPVILSRDFFTRPTLSQRRVLWNPKEKVIPFPILIRRKNIFSRAKGSKLFLQIPLHWRSTLLL